MKILLATDGSTFSDAAVEEVIARPWPHDSEVKVISVVEPPSIAATDPWNVTGDYALTIVKQLNERAENAVRDAVYKLSNSERQSLKVTSEIAQGPPKRLIVEEADRWGADLIVVGSHGYGMWDRLLLGSVSSAVAFHANCSVEIVRRPAATRREQK